MRADGRSPASPVFTLGRRLATPLLVVVCLCVSAVGSTARDVIRKAPYVLFAGDAARMEILWQLEATRTCTIAWGTDESCSFGSATSFEYGTDHQHAYTIEELAPGAIYHYRVRAAGETYRGTFRTGPPADASRLKFVAYGDTRSYPASHDSVAAGILQIQDADPEFQSIAVMTGDLVNDGNSELQWDEQFFDPTYVNIQMLLREVSCLSAMGNHEGAGVLFQKYWPYPFESDRYWSYDYGPAHFVVVDQYVDYGPGSPQLEWIALDLALSAKPWKFVYLHEPGWSAGGHENNENVQLHIQPLCEQYGVSIVFAGHNHYYARATVNGVHHVTTGGGGAPLYDPDAGYPCVVVAAKVHHFCTIEIDGAELDFAALTPGGGVVDTFSIDGAWMGVDAPGTTETEPGIHITGVSPNPITGGATVSFVIPEAANVEAHIYTVGGRCVAAFADRVFEAGRHRVWWDGRGVSGSPVPSGVYFCELGTGHTTCVAKVVVLR
jgi:hypothetical protein